MIAEFFISLFQINEQADRYWLQAAKINEERLAIRRMRFKYQKRSSIKAMDHCSDAFQYLGRQMRSLGKLMGKSITEIEKVRLN